MDAREEKSFNSLISLFKDEDYIYLKREDLEELKNSLPISNLLSIVNYSIAHNHSLPSSDENQEALKEENTLDTVVSSTEEDSTLAIQSSSEDSTIRETPEVKPKMEREESNISQAEEDDKEKENENENDIYKKKKFKKIKLTNDLKNKLDMILKQYKDDKWQTIKNMLNYIKEINTANPRYIELNIDIVHTVILNGMQNSRTAISRQALSVLSEVFLVQLDNLSPWLPQFFDILLSRLTSPQQFIVDEAINVIFQIQPLLPGKYYITQIKNAISVSNNPIHKSYYIRCLASLFETIGKKIEDYSPAYFDLLTRVNDNVPEQIKVFTSINNTLNQVYGEENVDTFLKSILKPPIFNSFKQLLSRKDKTQTPRSSTPQPEKEKQNTETDSDMQQQQVPVIPLTSSEPINIQKPVESQPLPINPTTPKTIIRREAPAEEIEKEESKQEKEEIKAEPEVKKEVETETNEEQNLESTDNNNNTASPPEKEQENDNNNEKKKEEENEEYSKPKEEQFSANLPSEYTTETKAESENGRNKFTSRFKLFVNKTSSKNDEVENRLQKLLENSSTFLDRMDEMLEKQNLSSRSESERIDIKS